MRRMVDAKEQLRALAGAALAEVPRRHAPEPVLSALARALAAARAPRTKVAVLEFFCTAATGSVDLEDQLEVVPGPALRTLVSAILHLALDKNGDIRRAAARAVSVVYHAGEGSTVVAAVQALPPAQGAAVQKALAAAVPSLEADLASALRAARPAPVAGAGSAAAPTASSRRHSGEGVLRLPELPLALLAARGGGAASATAPVKPPPAAAPPPRLPGKGAPLASPRCASPRGASPAGRRLGADGSPAGPSPMSRLGRQASSVSVSSAAAEAETELSRQPSSCITHTSSPAASAPVSRSASVTLAGSGGLAAAAAPAAAAPANQTSLPLGRAAGSTAPPAPSASVASQQQPGSAPPASMADLAPFDALMDGQLRRLLGQLQPGAPTCEAFQGLSRLAHVLPGSAWPAHFSQVRWGVCGSWWAEGVGCACSLCSSRFSSERGAPNFSLSPVPLPAMPCTHRCWQPCWRRCRAAGRCCGRARCCWWATWQGLSRSCLPARCRHCCGGCWTAWATPAGRWWWQRTTRWPSC